MSTRLHRQKHQRQKKEQQRRHRATQEINRRIRAAPIVDNRPAQSELSKRWISEAPEKGRCSKLEAIYKIQDESEKGKNISKSVEHLAKLITDPEKEISIAAGYAAGICARNGENPTPFILPLIDLLRSKDDLGERNSLRDRELSSRDLIVETAIESLGECAKHNSHSSRSLIIKKLLHIERNGADSETKANAGFALAQIIQDAPEIVFDKKFRKDLHLAFLKLTRSEDNFCKVAGTLGFCSIGIELAKAHKTDADIEDSIKMLGMIPTFSNEFVYYTAFLAYEMGLPYFDQNNRIKLYSSAITMLFAAPDINSLEHATAFVQNGLFDERMRLLIINGLAYWQVTGASALAQHALSKKALELFRSGISPGKILQSMDFENEKQKSWLDSQVKLGIKHNALEKVLNLGTLTENQLNLAMVKLHTMKILREQGVDIAKQAGSQLKTTYLY